ncbi:hypothetical protein GUJ93_ZPchr0013g33981 [Zizania palustris]|uniref:ACB domain-containing protein n=1 Tax=Zizania palustris TaxID=103762 RepID=A0A8J5WWR0_ZIZPA|nr:hypothetical protein GUJ93_ZPchr0013g33981 [Zizania palustris]
MELFYELLLTAAASLLAAFLLARLLAAAAAGSDPRRGPDRGGAIAEEEEERVIEVDEVVEVKEATECGRSGGGEVGRGGEGLGGVLARGGGGSGGGGRRSGSCARCRVGGSQGGGTRWRKSGAIWPLRREVVMEDVGVEQHALVTEVAPSEALYTELEKHDVPVIDAVEVKRQHDLGAEVLRVTFFEKFFDAGLDERMQAIEAGSYGLTSNTVTRVILDVSSEKQEEHVIEEKQHQLAAETAPRAILDVALTEKDELKEEQSVEESINVHEEVQSKDEAKCEPHLFDQEECLVSKEELVGRKTGHVETSHGSNSSDKVFAKLSEEDMTLHEVPADEAGIDMGFGEWERIERSEVEKRFGAAVAFASSDAGMAALSKLGSDVQLQLQGLLKVAIDGPYYDSKQPLTFRPYRAKWSDWHPEIAMEKYMNILSETIPGWTGDKNSTKKHEAGGDSGGLALTMTPHTSDGHNNQGDGMKELIEKLAAKIDDLKTSLDKLAPLRRWRPLATLFVQGGALQSSAFENQSTYEQRMTWRSSVPTGSRGERSTGHSSGVTTTTRSTTTGPMAASASSVAPRPAKTSALSSTLLAAVVHQGNSLNARPMVYVQL